MIGFLLIFLMSDLYAQNNQSRFSTLSRPEKWWVICHPLKAKKALDATLNTLHKTDSIKKTGVIGTDSSGGRLDAFKHAYWLAELSRQIGERAALSLGEAHEKGNYRDFLEGNLEDGALPDKASSDMDLYNNRVGARIHQRHPAANEREIVKLVLTSLKTGELRIIKKENTVYLTCEGEPISKKDLNGKWENSKCLIPSNL